MQIKQLLEVLNALDTSTSSSKGLNDSLLGKKVIIRLWYWKTNGGISLSEVAKTGLNSDSKVCTKVDNLWLEAIEIIPCTDEAIKSIESQNDYQA